MNFNPMMQMMQMNPLFRQAQQMAQGKSEQELKQICVNLCNSKGINLEDAFKQFQSQFPGLR